MYKAAQKTHYLPHFKQRSDRRHSFPIYYFMRLSEYQMYFQACPPAWWQYKPYVRSYHSDPIDNGRVYLVFYANCFYSAGHRGLWSSSFATYRDVSQEGDQAVPWSEESLYIKKNSSKYNFLYITGQSGMILELWILELSRCVTGGSGERVENGKTRTVCMTPTNMSRRRE